MYDPSLLLFVAGALTGIAVALLTLSVRDFLAAIQHIRRRLRRAP
jgi:hypothetical protein